MTDRFVCPEPSPEAVDAYFNYPATDSVTGGLRAAYLVDVPSVVRQEVELAMHWMAGWMCGAPSAFDARANYRVEGERRYLASRFGAPETEEPVTSCCHSAFVIGCEHCAKVQRVVNRLTKETIDATPPSTPRHATGCEMDTDHTGPCMKRCISEPGKAAPPSEAPAKPRCPRGCNWTDRLCDTSCVAAAREVREVECRSNLANKDCGDLLSDAARKVVG